jgi:hypothetical protein
VTKLLENGLRYDQGAEIEPVLWCTSSELILMSTLEGMRLDEF